MSALSWLALIALTCTAAFGALQGLQLYAPTLPADLRGLVAAGLTLAATALVIDRIAT